MNVMSLHVRQAPTRCVTISTVLCWLFCPIAIHIHLIHRLNQIFNWLLLLLLSHSLEMNFNCITAIYSSGANDLLWHILNFLKNTMQNELNCFRHKTLYFSYDFVHKCLKLFIYANSLGFVILYRYIFIAFLLDCLQVFFWQMSKTTAAVVWLNFDRKRLFTNRHHNWT